MQILLKKKLLNLEVLIVLQLSTVTISKYFTKLEIFQ